MKRYFEKISFEQFKKDIKDDINLYEAYKLPRRATKHSAGYDFYAIEEFTIQPGEVKKIAAGYKSNFGEDEMLLVIVRSSVGFKYNVRMCNQVGLMDKDFYNNETNEGHVFIALQNHSDKEFTVKQGEAYVQGIFSKFLITDDDEVISNERTGGLGSTTDKKEGD